MEDGLGESWIAASGVWPTSYKCCINKAFPLLEWHLGLFMRILWINKPLEKRAQEGEKKNTNFIPLNKQRRGGKLP